MDWITIAILLVAGVFLIIVEIIFVPGTTFVGVIGAICAGVGIYFTYVTYGGATGTSVLIGVLVFSALALVYGFKAGVWQRFSLKSTNQAKVERHQTALIEEGQEGTAVSVLRPVGKAMFNDHEYEVTTLGNYLEAGQNVRIAKISNSKIIVEPI